MEVNVIFYNHFKCEFSNFQHLSGKTGSVDICTHRLDIRVVLEVQVLNTITCSVQYTCEKLSIGPSSLQGPLLNFSQV